MIKPNFWINIWISFKHIRIYNNGWFFLRYFRICTYIQILPQKKLNNSSDVIRADLVVCRNICICGVLVVEQAAGADPGILVRGGGVELFFKGMGSGGRLEAPSGSRATPWWGPRGRSPRKLLHFSDFRSYRWYRWLLPLWKEEMHLYRHIDFRNIFPV